MLVQHEPVMATPALQVSDGQPRVDGLQVLWAEVGRWFSGNVGSGREVVFRYCGQR